MSDGLGIFNRPEKDKGRHFLMCAVTGRVLSAECHEEVNTG